MDHQDASGVRAGAAKLLSAAIPAGQRGDSPQFEVALAEIRVPRVGGPRTRPDRVLADKAYSSRGNRAYLRRHGIKAPIPIKADQPERPIEPVSASIA